MWHLMSWWICDIIDACIHCGPQKRVTVFYNSGVLVDFIISLLYHVYIRSLCVCVISLRNCEIWLQIKPNLDVSLIVDTGESERILEIRRNSLNVLIAEVHWNFVPKTERFYSLSHLVKTRIALMTEQWIDVQGHSRLLTFVAIKSPYRLFISD